MLVIRPENSPIVNRRSQGAPRVRTGFWVLIASVATAVLGSSAPAMDLNPAIQLTSGAGAGSDPALIIGPADSAFMVFVDNGQVRFASRPHENPSSLPVTTGPGMRSRPRLIVGSSGLVTVGFEEAGDVLYSQNPGGPFGVPIPLGQEAEVERHPCLTSSSGSPDRQAVWVRETGGGPTLVASYGLAMTEVVGLGDAPTCAMGVTGDLWVAYERAGDVFVRNGNGALGPEIPVATAAAVESAPSLDVTMAGLPRIVYESNGDIFFTSALAGGGFTPPVNLSNSAGPSTDPQIRVAPSGTLMVLYHEQGDLWLVVSAGASFGAPMNLTSTPLDTEGQASFDVDSLGFLHIIYTEGGEVYYRNDTTPPNATFQAAPVVGELPLSVSFMDQSTGVIETWLWNFGDGNTSTVQDPVHVYQSTGPYAVSLLVSGPGGSDQVTVTNAVQVTPATRIMRIPSIPLIQGQSDVEVPILVNHQLPIQGFQVALSWDCGTIDVVAATKMNTTTAGLFTEFYVVNIEPTGCFLTAGVIYDTLPPTDGRTLPPGQNQRILDLILSVSQFAPVGQPTVLDLRNGLGSPFPISNIFIEGGQSLSPVLIDGVVTVLPFALPLPIMFRRGDADRNNQINVADAVYVLSFLFSNGPSFLCPDSADVNDTGSVDIADAIALLGFLFTGGGAPAYPYPTTGLDPSPDSLGPCL